jgi:RNA polymerase sigma-70 factor, ECF subfamily
LTRSEESAAIERVMSGDSEAFESLVLENEKNVYHLALRMTSNEQDAQDVSQDVFIKAYTSLGSFRGDCRFSVWLYRMTYNICIDRMRKSGRITVIPTEYTNDEGDVSELEIPDTRSLPEDELLKAEQRQAVVEALDSLTPEHRQVLVMREYSDMTYEEIASVLGVSDGTVKSRLNRARRGIAQILVKAGTFEPAGSSKKRKGGDEA